MHIKKVMLFFVLNIIQRYNLHFTKSSFHSVLFLRLPLACFIPSPSHTPLLLLLRCNVVKASSDSRVSGSQERRFLEECFVGTQVSRRRLCRLAVVLVSASGSGGVPSIIGRIALILHSFLNRVNVGSVCYHLYWNL